MSRWNGQIFLATLSILLAGSLSSLAIVKMHTHAASGNKTKKLSELTVGQVVKVGGVSFVKTAADQLVAINLCPDGSTYSSFYQGCVSTTTDFAYTGGEQTFSVPADGYYVLEVWGAQGGSYEKTILVIPEVMVVTVLASVGCHPTPRFTSMLAVKALLVWKTLMAVIMAAVWEDHHIIHVAVAAAEQRILH